MGVKTRDGVSNAVHWQAIDSGRLKRARKRATAELPAEWMLAIDAEASARRSLYAPDVPSLIGAREVYGEWADKFGGAAAADMTDGQIKARAEEFALEARLIDIGELARPWHEYERLLNFCAAREVSPPPVRLLLKGMSARVRCPYWWRRALRKMVARRCETGALSLGLVSAPNKQPYASNKAVWRSVDQDKRNKAALENTWFENDEGYRASLADLAASSVSNKAIRRGELMTRIRGCEEIADQSGHVGLFTTHTCPSRFHSTLRWGGRNPKHDGSTPREAQDWLCKMWGRAGAKLARMGVRYYGFRVAEPHHDGCTHWHMLVWFESDADLKAWRRVVHEYWLSDDGQEAGASKHRTRFKRMLKGGAAGYVAKYIAKNIDDHKIDAHTDDYAECEIGPDLLGDLEIKPSTRVQAWARTWGIRQFQGFGQPPVTVWRELRRVKEVQARAAGVGGIVHRAWLAAQRVGLALADWGRYVLAQGGLMRGRRCHVVMRVDRVEVDGLYGAAMRDLPIGVALNVRGSRTVYSERRLWRAVEKSESEVVVLGARSAAPRTRVNNSTVGEDADAVRMDFLRGGGGHNPGDFYENSDFGPPGPGSFDHRQRATGNARALL